MAGAGWFAIAASAPGDASAGAVVVTAVGIRADQGGSLVVALYRDKASRLDEDKAFLKKVMKVESDSMTVIFEGVPLDSTYAVEVIHDKNDNGKLDMRKFPYPRPKEGAGVSNNTFRLGPPAYDKARFALAESSVIVRVVMRY
ncbi:MAG: DUF2141 domain-containing protein [Candidatus Krumholzibacteriia bacterium]